VSQNDNDLFFAERVYQDAPAIFSLHPKSLREVKDDCIVVLDTNVLLAPYTSVSQKNLSLIAETYKALIGEGRMVVPGQAAREFARNRPKKLTELHQQLSDLKSQNFGISLNSYPLLRDMNEYTKVLELSKEIADTVRAYKRSLTELLEEVESWEWNDPVSKVYEALFDASVVVDPEFDRENIKEDLNWRKQNNVPPGYKDSGKVGDLLIWHTILSLGASHRRDLIFVTGDEKPDWWHRSNSRNLYPRHELVEEYRRESGGASFHMLDFPDFLALYGVNEEVVEQVRQATPGYLRDKVAVVSNGQILVMKHRGTYGAIQPIEQRTEPNGYIEYVSWFLPDGSSDFNQPGVAQVRNGRARAAEVGDSIEVEQLQIGPMRLLWSGATAGTGYVYFDRSPAQPPGYSVAVLDETDISQVDASRVKLFDIQLPFLPETLG
jgi:hypothetical protein